MAIEKRKGRRIRVSLPIKIAYQHNRSIIANTENISMLGTYIEIDRQIPLGTNLDISLNIPAYTKNLSLTGEARCQGNIFRCNPARESGAEKYYGIGIFFTNFLNEADKGKLSRYLDFLAAKEEKNIKEGAKHLQEKRKTAQAPSQTQTFDLLKQILKRLDEISRFLKSQKSP